MIPPIAAILTALPFSYLCDKIGRKKTLLLIAIPQMLSFILISVAKSIYIFYLSRFLSGIGDACLFSSVPMYIGEVATPKVRGSWGNMLTFFIYLGQFSINVIGSFLSVRQAAYVCMVFPILFASTFIFMPESPYFLIMKDNYDGAKASLRKLHRKHNVDLEFETMKNDVQRQMSETGTWIDLFTIRSNRKSLIAGIFLRASQQLGGISSFMVFTQYIFDKSGGNLEPRYSAIIFMSLIVIFNILAGICLDKLGRRRAYMYSLLLCAIILFIEASYFYLDQFSTTIDVSSFNWVPLAGLITYVVFYSFGLGIVPTLMMAELFSASIKGKALSVLNIVFAVLVCSTTKIFYALQTNIGMFAPFLLFSMSCCISTVLSLYFVPETKGKTLEEIQQSLKGTKKTKK